MSVSYWYHWFAIRMVYGFHFGKPLYALRVIRNIIMAKMYRLLGVKKFVLRGIDFGVTYTCNFNCEHCYAKKLKNDNRSLLTVEDYRRVCEQAMKLGCLCYSLQGGEIFLRKEWREIIKAFRPHYNHILLTTNGSLISEPLVVELKELGVDTIYFSVDSGFEAEHDMFRKHPGSFSKIFKAVDSCRKHGVKVVFNICVTSESLRSDGLKALLDYTHENRILVETIFARCLGNYDGNFKMMLTENDVRDYYALRKKYPYVVRDLDNNYGKWGCPSVKEVLYITAYGDVCPCPYSHISLGNVKDTDLATIRERGLSNPWYDHYHPECLTALDKDFMGMYYPKIEKKPLIDLCELER